MALQDLTPQLRTRLSRMERAVGWFVIIATLLLLCGFGYYVYNLAERKGWFITKIPYQTSISSGAGLKVGDPVKLMGFDVGEITSIEPNKPYEYFNITIYFRIKDPHYGYIWSDSAVKVNADNFLGQRYLEVTKGKGGVPTVLESTNDVDGILRWDVFRNREKQLEKQFASREELLKALNDEAKKNPRLYYTNLIARETAPWLEPQESPAVTERLEKLVSQVEDALPGILSLTNQLGAVLSNSVHLTSNLTIVASDARPTFSNLARLTGQLDHPGALGELLIPTNLNQKLDGVLGGADDAMANANTNLLTLNQSLINLGNLTSNLNNQVQANSNILSNMSKAIVDADDLVQGLKRHWLLRSAFKKQKTNEPKAVQSPKEKN